VKNKPVLALMLPGLILVTFIAGCGGGSSTPPPPPPPPPPLSVSITVTTGTVGAGGTVGLTAMVNNDTSGKGVTWSLSPASGAGMLTNETSSSAMYNAPATPPASDVMVTITATSVADPTQSAPVTIDFAAIQVLLSASVNPVQAGGTSVITAMVNFDPANKGVDPTSWMITCSTSPCGTLGIGTNTMVTYTAPSTPPASDVQATITATSVSSPKQMGNTGITFAAIVVFVSPNPATVAEDTSLSFAATVSFDPSNAGVNWTLTQGTPPTPCPTIAPLTCGSISSTNSPSGTPITYTAPSVVPSPATVTLTATSVTDTTKSDPVAITVVNPDAALTGQYAFLFQGFDDATGMQVAVAGSFTADGLGNITGGEEDINGPSGAHTLVTITGGTYIVGLDNRGTMTLTNSLPGSVTYALSVGSFNAGVAVKGRLIEFDDNNGATLTRGSGVMRLQDPTAFTLASIKGSYGFGLSGQDNGGGRLASAGIFSADGAGNITSGTEDSNDAGTVHNNVAFTGTYLAPDANGRATGSVTYTSPSTSFSLYVVSASEAFLMTTDLESTSGLQSGDMLLQASTPYSKSSLNANSVFYEVGVNSASPMTQSDVRIGLFTANGNGGLTIVSDENDGGTITTDKTASGLAYSVAANGRVTITGGAGTPPILYLVDSNKAFLLGGDASVGFGFLEPQSGEPFGLFSLSGTFFSGVAPPAVTASTVSSGIGSAFRSCRFFPFRFCSNVLRLTQDSSASDGTLTSGAVTSSNFTVSSNGRTINGGDVIYLISPKKFVRIDELSSDVAPTVSIFEQ
jgi:hypothetical protein